MIAVANPNPSVSSLALSLISLHLLYSDCTSRSSSPAVYIENAEMFWQWEGDGIMILTNSESTQHSYEVWEARVVLCST
jgi:hypothetical protein